MKEYTCLQVGHHKNIAKTIEKFERDGWRLHTYTCAGYSIAGGTVNHYLLFVRGE